MIEMLTKVIGFFTRITVGEGHADPSLPKRHTVALLAALECARQEAQLRGASEISVGDLLAGLAAEEDSRAQRIAQLKLNAVYLRWLTCLPALPAPSLAKSETTALEPDSEARRALVFAVQEADRDREYWIDSDHLLRGLLRFENKAAFALLKTEVNLRKVRSGSRLDREEYLPVQHRNREVVKYLARKYAALLALPLLSLACYLYVLLEEFGPAGAPLLH